MVPIAAQHAYAILTSNVWMATAKPDRLVVVVVVVVVVVEELWNGVENKENERT